MRPTQGERVATECCVGRAVSNQTCRQLQALDYDGVYVGRQLSALESCEASNLGPGRDADLRGARAHPAPHGGDKLDEKLGSLGWRREGGWLRRGAARRRWWPRRLDGRPRRGISTSFATGDDAVAAGQLGNMEFSASQLAAGREHRVELSSGAALAVIGGVGYGTLDAGAAGSDRRVVELAVHHRDRGGACRARRPL